VNQRARSLVRDNKGFTGLEAAIVLTAFIVVAAVFSYVVLNAGFFTSEKSKEVVHTGVQQVTSSMELAGNVIAHGWKYNSNTSGNHTYYYNASDTDDNHTLDSTNLTVVELYLTLTAGQSPIDMDRLTISYTDEDTHVGELNYTKTNYDGYKNGTLNETGNVSKGNFMMGNWTYWTADTPGAEHNNLLETDEKVIVLIGLPEYGVTAGKSFSIELKPSTGAVIEITKKAPGQIDKTMILY